MKTPNYGWAKMNEGYVLIPNAGTSSALAIIRSLGSKNIPVKAVSHTHIASGMSSKFVKLREICPNPFYDTLNYLKYLLEEAKKEDCFSIFPVDDQTVILLSKNKKKFMKYISGAYPDYSMLQKVRDRFSLMQLSESIGIPIPEYEIIEGGENKVDKSELTPPYVLKPRVSHLLKNDKVVTQGVEFFQSLSEVSDFISKHKRDFLLQEYIPGRGYGYFCLIKDGSIKAEFQHKRIREFRYTGGASSMRESFYDKKLENYGIKFLENMGWEGVAMLEFRKDSRDNEYKIMEVNPRFWGSLNLAVQAGVDFPYLLYRILRGEKIDTSPPYKKGVKCGNFHGEITHLASTLLIPPTFGSRPSFWRTLDTILKDNTTSHHDFITLRDLKPSLVEVLDTLYDLGAYYYARLYR